MNDKCAALTRGGGHCQQPGIYKRPWWKPGGMCSTRGCHRVAEKGFLFCRKCYKEQQMELFTEQPAKDRT